MPVTIANNSKELVSSLLRKEFDKNSEVWQEQNAKDVIKDAKYLVLNELAEEMQNDL